MVELSTLSSKFMVAEAIMEIRRQSRSCTEFLAHISNSNGQNNTKTQRKRTRTKLTMRKTNHGKVKKIRIPFPTARYHDTHKNVVCASTTPPKQKLLALVIIHRRRTNRSSKFLVGQQNEKAWFCKAVKKKKLDRLSILLL